MKTKTAKFTGSAEMEVVLERMVAVVNRGSSGMVITKR